ncbi:hypothetical protein PISMIDRAFT_118585 [Pisolithus microcarpus 441]|uniref:Uncharacterized protein n=1 Tax=Pisolithus microcarpus 441 TaxID=765257 RepID=A0A0C9Y9R3_9AGAM|nr:hypothetical protein BKA83DRAFT_118585 [Pisolithus microcarpus]KIK13631.1 hypothetical protein PISMIDRAFT_118585 [Pisolithus microcarpus 441]
MATIIRNAKSSNDWTVNELDAYNISIVSEDCVTFFGTDILPLPDHHHDLINKLTANEMEDDDSYLAARYMDLATNRVPDEESAVVDFVMQLLHTMGYATRAAHRDLRSRKAIDFFICGEWKDAKADVCVMDGYKVLLVVQEDKCHMQVVDPNAQLVAAAIAAVQNNNRMRSIVGSDVLDFKEMAGIVMIDTHPTFFKIPVTKELIQAVQRGQFPSTPTVVSMHLPTLPRPAECVREGMRPLDNRRIIIACFEVFKQFVKW